MDTEVERLRLLAAASDLLTATADTGQALRNLAGLFVPLLADWSVVDVVTGPDLVSRRAVLHRDADRTTAPYEGDLPRLPARSTSALVTALREGQIVVRNAIDQLSAPQSDFHRAQVALFSAFGAAHAAVVPLMARGTAVGALTLVRHDPQWPFADSEVSLIEGVARRTALALDNARLHMQHADTAAAFQRSLLPSLPRPGDLRLAARYLPAGLGRRIGGDWYDAFVGPDGDTVVVIGDVVGHDVHSSARMAELRNLLRGCAWHAPPSPAAILDRLVQTVKGLDVAAMATILCGRIERKGHHRLHWATAGHLPPLVVTPGCAPWYERGASGIIVGVASDQPYLDNLSDILPGAKLLLYTDGLIEHRGDLRDGMRRLADAAGELADAPLEAFCDGIIERLAAPHDDDVALLAVQFPTDGA